MGVLTDGIFVWLQKRLGLGMPSWYKLIPFRNMRPEKDKVPELESLRREHDIRHDLFFEIVVGAPTTTRQVQEYHFSLLKQEYCSASDTELLSLLYFCRNFPPTGALWGMTEAEIREAIGTQDEFHSLDDLVNSLNAAESPEWYRRAREHFLFSLLKQEYPFASDTELLSFQYFCRNSPPGATWGMTEAEIREAMRMTDEFASLDDLVNSLNAAESPEWHRLGREFFPGDPTLSERIENVLAGQP